VDSGGKIRNYFIA